MPKLLTLLSKDQHQMLIKHFCEQAKIRRVYYFDTSDLLLKQNGFSIKVEHIDSSLKYTLKVKQHGSQENILLEHISEENFQSLNQTSTHFSKSLTEFLGKHSDKRLIKLGALMVTGITREECEVTGFWTVHKNLYPSGYEEQVFGLSHCGQNPKKALSLFKEALRAFEINEQPIQESRRDLFLK